MLFCEAARRWRSQDDRIPTEDLSTKSKHKSVNFTLSRNMRVKDSRCRLLPDFTPSWGTGLRCGVLKRCRRILQVSLAPGSESCSLQAEHKFRHTCISQFSHIYGYINYHIKVQHLNLNLVLDRLHQTARSGVFKEVVRTKCLLQVRAVGAWHASFKMSQTQPNCMAEWDFVSVLGEKKKI